jgi:hypothetical protein
MPDAILSDEQWESLKVASIKGVSDADLALAYGVERSSIRQRRCRDEIWQAAKGVLKPIVTDVVTDGQKEVNLPSVPASSSSSTSALAQKVALTVSENISKLGEQNRLLALQIAGKGLKQANAAPPDVQSWQDVKALMDIVAKASGMDQAQAVQVNVLSSQPMDFSPHFEPAIETDKVVEV